MMKVNERIGLMLFSYTIHTLSMLEVWSMITSIIPKWNSEFLFRILYYGIVPYL
ncbi:hypothetical protein [Flavobacterium sp.]|uniref:hypothetical protein n=1 Tax=Flavobacterium sp. TaxID=239 RepID=UPI003528EFFC